MNILSSIFTTAECKFYNIVSCNTCQYWQIVLTVSANQEKRILEAKETVGASHPLVALLQPSLPSYVQFFSRNICWISVCVCVAGGAHAKLLQPCLTLCNPMDCSPPGSSVHGILLARTLEWVALPSSKGSSRPRDWICISYVLHWQADSLPLMPPGKPNRLCILYILEKPTIFPSSESSFSELTQLVTNCVGFPCRQVILLDINQVSYKLTPYLILSIWRWCQIPQTKGSGPQEHSPSPSDADYE